MTAFHISKGQKKNAMNDYNVIAGVYDRINSGVDYGRWGDYVEEMLGKYLAARPELVLDLACGTGSMTLELAGRGYDMIGVDLSEEMLAEATDRMYLMIDDGVLPEEGRRPLFLCQDIRNFELYGTVGAAVCCLDSLNYLIGDGELERVFATVHNYLDPNGLFIFDMNTPYKFEKIYGDNSYVYELDGANDSGKTLDGARVYYLDDLAYEVSGPAMAEGLDYLDGGVITLTESASNKYIFGKLFFAYYIVSLDFE